MSARGRRHEAGSGLRCGLADLRVRWRAEAAVLRHRAATGYAEVLESCAVELEEYEREHELEALTLDQAVAESGYAYSALQKMVTQGRVPNAGAPHRPRIHRKDLPKKPQGAFSQDGSAGPDLAALVGSRR